MQDYKRALYDFSAAIRAESRTGSDKDASRLGEYYMQAGQCNQNLGQYEEALAHYDIAKKKDKSALIFYNRGLTCRSLGKY